MRRVKAAGLFLLSLPIVALLYVLGALLWLVSDPDERP